jgi:hypothetical protein
LVKIPIPNSELFGIHGDTYHQFQGRSVDLAKSQRCAQGDNIYKFAPWSSLRSTSWQFKIDLSSSYNFEVSGVAMKPRWTF